MKRPAIAIPKLFGLDLAQRHRPVLFLAGNGLYLCLIFLFPFLLTYAIVSKSEFARFVFYLNITAMLIDGMSLGVYRGIQQLTIQTPEGRLRRVLSRPLQATVGLLGAILVALTAGMLYAFAAYPGWFENSFWIAFWIWLTVALGVCRLCVSGLLYGLRRYGWFIVLDLSWAALRIPVVVLLWWTWGLTGALAGQAFLWGFTLVLGLFILVRDGIRLKWGPWGKAFGSIRYFLRFGLWLHLTTLAGTLIRPLAIFLLAIMVGRDNPAITFTHLSLSLFLVVAILLDALFMALYPEKARAGVEGRRGELAAWANEEARSLGFLSWPLAVAVAWLMPLAVRILRPEYHDLSLWLAPIIMAAPARAMAAPLIYALQASHRAKSGAAFQAMRLVIDLAGLGLSLIWWHGQGATPAWGILAGEWVSTVLLFLIQQRGEAGQGTLRSTLRSGTIASLGLMGVILIWSEALRLIDGGRTGWKALALMSAGWYLILPLTGLVHWRGILRTFNPKREKLRAAANPL